MSREKQIEEMEKNLCQNDFCSSECRGHCRLGANSYCRDVEIIAEKLYNAGYRKQSEGEWLEIDDGVLIGDGKHLECSECGAWKKDKQRSNFCPNCGAKMKGGE